MRNIDNYENYLKEIISELFIANSNSFLRLREIRSKMSEKVVSELYEQKDIVLNQAINRSETVSHNIKGLVGMAGYDRGAELTDKAFSVVPKSIISMARVLHIGARNLNELFATRSYGIRPENIYSIDLIELPGFNVAGDMHNLPFDTNMFDVIILGWVLAYSTDHLRAINEINRVAKDSATLAIGWDFSEFSYEDHGLLNPSEELKIKNTHDIIKIIKESDMLIEDIKISVDAKYPYTEEYRRNSLVFSLKKSNFSISHNWMIEAALYKSAAEIDIFKADPTISQRFLSAADNLQNELFRKDEGNRVEYLLMRQHYVRYGGVLDEFISQNISKIFPPMYELSPLNIKSIHFEKFREEILSEGAAALESSGYYIFPCLLGEEIIHNILLSYQVEKEFEGRVILPVDDLLKNRTIIDLWMDSVLISLSERFLKTVPILDYVTGFCSRPINSREIEKLDKDALLYHFDKDRVKFLKIFVYLSDVDGNNGPHSLIPGSQLIVPLKDGRYLDAEVSDFKIKNNLQEMQIIGRKGTIFAVNTHCMHRGNVVLSGERIILEMEYTNSIVGAPTSIKSSRYFKPKYMDVINMFPRSFSHFSAG